MNWNKLNEQYPQAVLELFRQTIDEDATSIEVVKNIWLDIKYEYGLCKCENFPLSVLQDQFLYLPEYFDGLGIHILTGFEVSDRVFSCEVIDTIGRRRISTGLDFPTRREALEAGIVKAFEIREGQLKQVKS